MVYSWESVLFKIKKKKKVGDSSFIVLNLTSSVCLRTVYKEGTHASRANNAALNKERPQEANRVWATVQLRLTESKQGRKCTHSHYKHKWKIKKWFEMKSVKVSREERRKSFQLFHSGGALARFSLMQPYTISICSTKDKTQRALCNEYSQHPLKAVFLVWPVDPPHQG